MSNALAGNTAIAQDETTIRLAGVCGQGHIRCGYDNAPKNPSRENCTCTRETGHNEGPVSTPHVGSQCGDEYW